MDQWMKVKGRSSKKYLYCLLLAPLRTSFAFDLTTLWPIPVANFYAYIYDIWQWIYLNRGVPPGARFDPYGPPGIPGFEPNRFARYDVIYLNVHMDTNVPDCLLFYYT